MTSEPNVGLETIREFDRNQAFSSPCCHSIVNMLSRIVLPLINESSIPPTTCVGSRLGGVNSASTVRQKGRELSSRVVHILSLQLSTLLG